MVKNTEFDTKMNLLQCLRAKLHHKEVLEPVVGVVVGAAVHLKVLKLISINIPW